MNDFPSAPDTLVVKRSKKNLLGAIFTMLFFIVGGTIPLWTGTDSLTKIICPLAILCGLTYIKYIVTYFTKPIYMTLDSEGIHCNEYKTVLWANIMKAKLVKVANPVDAAPILKTDYLNLMVPNPESDLASARTTEATAAVDEDSQEEFDYTHTISLQDSALPPEQVLAVVQYWIDIHHGKNPPWPLPNTSNLR